MLSCFVATTPWSGGRRLCQALRATTVVGHPEDYFNPLTAVARSRRWALLGSPDGQFPGRYLTSAREAATGDNGVCSAYVPWAHLRWLVRMARAADPDATTGSSDAGVVEAWFPGIRYIHLRCRDTATQALRWYEALNAGPGTGTRVPIPVGDGPLDLQEVRWLETLIARHERGWQTFFAVHGIDAQLINYEQFSARPLDTVAAVLAGLGLPSRLPVGWDATAAGEPAPAAAARLAQYRERRQELPKTVGVRAAPR